MEKDYTQITLQGGKESRPVVIDEGTLWFSQKTISKLLGITTQAFAYHLREWQYNNLSSGAKEFSISQREGMRVITRIIKHYPLATTYSIANATRKMDCIMPIIKLAKQYKVTVNELFITVRKERQFKDLLIGLLYGIVDIKTQYWVQGDMIDFYIPELKLGIEYDEYPHQSEKRMKKDIMRHNNLQQSSGMRFIRINRERR